MAAGEAVLVRGVGRAVVVVLRGGEVAGPEREKVYETGSPPPSGPHHGVPRHAVPDVLTSPLPIEAGDSGPCWVWEISPSLCPEGPPTDRTT